MAGSLKDVEFRLPTEFFTVAELHMEKENLNKNELGSGFKSGFSFPTEFPYEFDSFGSSSSSSSLSSPDESVVGSNETESGDADDFLAGLTRRLTHELTVKPEKQWVMAGSPESTLSGIGSWSVSSNGSPNALLSPPTTPFGANNDLILAAAEVARFKMSGEGNKYNNHQGRRLLGPVRGQNSDTALKNQNIGCFSSQNTGHSISQMNQVLKPRYPSVWGRQQVKVGLQTQSQSQPQRQHHHPQLQAQSPYQQQQIQSRNRAVAGYENGRCMRPVGLPPSVWPPLEVQSNPHHHQPPQQHSVTGTSAVFLGGSGVKRECAGTGVFLPRRYGNPTDSKKKSVCSTVLLPAKVVQALNLNAEDININCHTHPRFNTCFPSDYDAMMARRNALLAQQKRNLRYESVINHEVARLPQEWTY